MLTNNITRLLTQRKIHFTMHDLGTTEKLGAVEVSNLLGKPEEKVFKTIIFMSVSGNGKFLAALVPANHQVDTKKLAAAVREKKVSPVKQVEAEETTGMQTGGISPLGLIHKPFRIIADDSINSLDTVIISAGQRGWQIELQPTDLLILCKAQTKPISAPIT